MDESIESEEETSTTETTSERKIIYTASASIYTDNLTETITIIKSNINEDEWLDKESISDDYASFIIRVKSDRLDAFMTAISSSGEVSNYTKVATDISLDYQDTSNQITSLETERARLVELYASASTTADIITINTRISEIDLELGTLQGTLNSYDSLIDYSEVTLSIRETSTGTELSFGQRISNMFESAWIALGDFFEWVFLALVAIFPFAVVFVPIGVGIYFLIKYIKKKKKAKLSKKPVIPTEKEIK
jgi:hypothetical protein